MSTYGLDTIDALIERAGANGILQSIETRQTYIEEAGIAFLVRWASSLNLKDAAARKASRSPHPAPNPFLPPEPELTLGPVGDSHLAVLNKFPVIPRHLLIVTRVFEAQTSTLTHADFSALAELMSELGGLGFYNGGTEAGASQPHKHLQWIPESPQSDCLRRLSTQLPEDTPPEQVICHPNLSWRHAFMRMPASEHSSALSARTLQTAFALGCEACGIVPRGGQMPPYNMLINEQWMLVLPRSREHFRDISVNALGFAGSIFVRHPEQINLIREIGPLQLLASVACPRKP